MGLFSVWHRQLGLTEDSFVIFLGELCVLAQIFPSSAVPQEPSRPSCFLGTGTIWANIVWSSTAVQLGDNVNGGQGLGCSHPPLKAHDWHALDISGWGGHCSLSAQTMAYSVVPMHSSEQLNNSAMSGTWTVFHRVAWACPDYFLSCLPLWLSFMSLFHSEVLQSGLAPEKHLLGLCLVIWFPVKSFSII